jgi:transposase InsO family protein
VKLSEQNKQLLAMIQQIKADHPYWGYRRVWAYLKYRQGIPINHKRVYRLMGRYNLLVIPDNKLKAIRSNKPLRSKPRAIRPNEYWGIDMTKIIVGSSGWAYLVIVLDWYTKKIVGFSLKRRSCTEDWLEALDNAMNTQFPHGRLTDTRELSLISDNGSQPTSKRFMQTCSILSIKQIFTCYNNPKGNADTERVIRTIKEDLIWIKEWATSLELEENLRCWIHRYNTDYPHSTLQYKTPAQYEHEYMLCPSNYCA